MSGTKSAFVKYKLLTSWQLSLFKRGKEFMNSTQALWVKTIYFSHTEHICVLTHTELGIKVWRACRLYSSNVLEQIKSPWRRTPANVTNVYINSQPTILEILCTKVVFKVINVPRTKLVHTIYFNIRTTINGQYFYTFINIWHCSYVFRSILSTFREVINSLGRHRVKPEEQDGYFWGRYLYVFEYTVGKHHNAYEGW